MNSIYWGYGAIGLFLGSVIFLLEYTRKKNVNFTEYATAGQSYGAFFSTMAFINTWLPGTIFIIFAGMGASSGVLGYYFSFYSLLAVLLMFYLADPVYVWGKKYQLRSQADLIGLRYQSNTVRATFAIISLISSFPWIILGLQSLTLVFSHLSFGSVSPEIAVYVGIAFLLIRQIWTVRQGAHGIIMSDMLQGLLAYGLGTLMILGVLVWLLGYSEGIAKVHPEMFTLPGPDSAQGPLYFFSIVMTGALGGWCWPEIFVRLFASDTSRTIKRSAVQAAPIVCIFALAIISLGIVGSTLPEITKDNTDSVWFLVSEKAGAPILILSGLCVLAATMGGVGAGLQALGTQTANDLILLNQKERTEDPKLAMITITVITIIAAIFSILTAGKEAGLVSLALLSYQGITQLAPTLFFGVFWRKGNSIGAVAGMICGFVLACTLEYIYPDSIPALWGLTSGVVAMFFNALIYIICSYLFPHKESEQQRINELFSNVQAHKHT